MKRLFDAYIIVDWSAAAKPVSGANSIWIGWVTRDASGRARFSCENPKTRLQARVQIHELAGDFIARGSRVLIGFDFAFGYPTGTAKAIGLKMDMCPPWKAMHDFLSLSFKEQTDNSNTRFDLASILNAKMTSGPHPFWGVPTSQVRSTLKTTKGDFKQPGTLAEHRIAEHWIRSQFMAHPKSVWQLLGAGAVGSQSLLGIPTVAFLRSHLSDAQIWPFETGLEDLNAKRLENTSCVLAEVYPSTLSITPKAGEILDQIQVETLSKRLESLDSAGFLGSAFAAPNTISSREITEIVGEEGWILAK